MGQNSSLAASLKPEQRKQLFIEMQSSSQQITAIAKREGVSRKFLYQQQQKGNQALEKEFNQTEESSEILYWIPVTKEWIFQVILALIFICHSSYRGVVEFFRDLFDYPVSVATVHNRVNSVVEKAQKINQSQDLSGIKVGLKDEIFQSRLPVLAGIDAFSTYCYLLVGADHRDEDTWGCHLLDASEQGLNPDYSIADAAKGLRAGPDRHSRSELWDFIVAELQPREALCRHRIRPFRRALENQKEDLLAFAAILDDKLTEISKQFQIPLYLVRQVCLLQGQNPSQTSYWKSWNQLHQQIGSQFYLLTEAREKSQGITNPRVSSSLARIVRF